MVLLFIASNTFPWDWVNGPLNIIQFPWRLYGLAAIFISVAIGAMLDTLVPSNYQRAVLIMVIAFLGIHATWVINISGSQPRDLPPDYYRQTQNTFLINNAEWLNVQTDLEGIRNKKAEVLDDGGLSIPFTRRGLDLQIGAIPQCEYLDMPLIYYVGYAANSLDEAGNKTDLHTYPALPDYTVRVDCPSDTSILGIRVSYRGTFLQKASMITNFSFICALAFLFMFKRSVFK
jgi:hypothetical protein